ncbi:MAG: type II toxin-antitoxin system HicA family toxin [Burkholderiales bacterium]|nr:type II toxin-antitoxin system HicA family toxin [Burkholderiales bacterium]
MREAGWRFLRPGKGSHEIWRNAAGETITVPHNCRSRHTANGILKDAGISHRF